MTDNTWADGYAHLLLAFGGGADDREAAARGRLYREHLDELSDDEWLRAATRAIGECRFFPRIAELLAFARADGSGSALARSAEVFTEILDHYERGVRLTQRQVLERWGQAARDAFMAAGGVSAFAWCGDPETRKFKLRTFQQAWSDSVGALGPHAALPAGERPQLPDGHSLATRG